MTENWSAVAKAIRQRLAEIGMTQKQLARHSGVSITMTREIVSNVIQRRRGARTLQAISAALGWHQDHLSGVLQGRTDPPAQISPAGDAPSGHDLIAERLAEIDKSLHVVMRQLGNFNSGHH